MPASDWATLRKLVEAAQRLPSGERPDFLKKQCGDDKALLNEILSLLKHEDEADTFLEPPAPMEVAPLFRGHQAASYIGKTIGPFEITGLLGYGGMGLVLRARQSNPPREVALKIVRGGSFVDRRQLRLFEREIRSLARLSHPAIASLYEAGCTEDGQHYFAMELVEGEAITTFARNNDLPMDRRLTLFEQLCQAIHYAHQRGVIHRDLKPGNVLVTPSGQVKVLDFGLAKITDSDLTATSILAAGDKVEGTVAYMSPEQAHGAAAEIDVRSDVYSLGVILYELLTLRLPYDMGAHLPEIIRQVAGEPPIRPSTVMRALRGDLETIILKALEKEPQRRYQSAQALADDIERFLNQEPISARPPSAVYQIRKLVARHKAAAAMALSIAVLLTASLVALSILYARAERQANIANNISDVLTQMLMSASPTTYNDRDYSVRDMLSDFGRRISPGMFADPESEARIRATMAMAVSALGDYESAQAHYEVALAIRRKLNGVQDRRYLEILFNQGWNHHNAHQFEQAADMFQECLAHYQNMGDREWVGETLYSLADVETHLGRFAEARVHAEKALETFREHEHERARQHRLPMALIILAEVEHKLHRNEEALQLLREAVDLTDERRLDTLCLRSHQELGKVLIAMGQPEEATKELVQTLEEYKRILPPMNELIGVTHLLLGRARIALDDRLSARPHLEEAIRILQTHEFEAERLNEAQQLLNRL